MTSYILDKAYSIEEAEGGGAYRVVVHGEASGSAKLPAEANAGGALGVTVHSQMRQGSHVAVRKAGIARVIAAGPIAPGDPVNVAGSDGKVKAVDEEGPAEVNCLGFAETGAGADGDLVEIFIAMHQRIVLPAEEGGGD
jgi:hypothetical protein